MDVPDLFASLPASRAERWSWIAALVAEWFGPLRPEDGIPEDQVRAAEARLGVALPKAVREAYLLFGRRAEITTNALTLTPTVELRVRQGLLAIARDSADRWAIRAADLSLEDPPVVVPDPEGHLHPALPGDDTTVSRFFVYMAIRDTASWSRYANHVYEAPMDEVAPILEKGFRVLDFGDVVHPEPVTRVYGGRRCIVVVLPTEEEVTLAAPDLDSYRAAVAASLGVDWSNDEKDAHRGDLDEQKERMERVEELLREVRQGRLDAVREEVRDAEERRPRWAGADPDAEVDVDPRLRALCARAVVPYAKVLPPVARAYVEKAAAVVLDVHPRLTAWARAFVGLPPDPLLAAELLAIDSTRERMSRGIERLEGVLSRGSAVDSALLSRAREATRSVLFRWPRRPPADRDERERELDRIVRQIMASLFAGTCAQVSTFEAAGYADALEAYAWARLVFDDFEGAPGDRHMLARYYAGRRREKVEPEDTEPLRAALDHLAESVASAPERIELPEGIAGAWSPAARPWMEAQLAKERLRLAERRKKR